MQERKTNYVLMYLVCQHMVFGVRQLQKEENWVKKPKKEWCTWAKQLMKELCTTTRHLLVFEDLCVGVRQLPTDGCWSLELDNSQ
jgi:hypothetical protein